MEFTGNNNAVSDIDITDSTINQNHNQQQTEIEVSATTSSSVQFTIVGQSTFSRMMMEGIPEDFNLMMDNEAFDKTIGALEDIVMSQDFQSLHVSQMEKHYAEFSPDYENPIDFEIFKEYSQTMGQFIEHELRKAIPDFEMEQFVYALQHRVRTSAVGNDMDMNMGMGMDCDGEIFEMLSTLTDFNKFHELIEDYRNMKEGKTIDMSPGITVQQIK